MKNIKSHRNFNSGGHILKTGHSPLRAPNPVLGTHLFRFSSLKTFLLVAGTYIQEQDNT